MDDEEKPASGRRSWHEGIEAVVAMCALIVSIVSLWTTTQISGVQDYLQSEIRRRNNELNGISDRSASLERVANDRAERLTSLQLSTDAVIASALDAQKRFVAAQADLARVRGDVLASQANLVEARAREAQVREQMISQADAFDLFTRIQAKDYASLNVAFSSISDKAENEGPTGKAHLSAIQSLVAPSGQKLLQPYLDRIKSRIVAVCPWLPTWTAELPPVPPAPEKPTISYMSNASREEIARLTKEAQEKYLKDLNAHYDASDIRNKKQSEEMMKLGDLTRNCICLALADDKFDSKQICTG